MKTKKILTAIFCAAVIIACKKNEPAPVTPIDYTLYDKSEIIGEHTGTVVIKDNKLNKTQTEAAQINFASVSNNTLALFLLKPAGKSAINATNFKKSQDDTYYYFDIASYSNFLWTGNEIPVCIQTWYSNLDNKTKAIITSATFKDVKFDKATKVLTFTMDAKVSIYQQGFEDDPTNTTITYTYTVNK